MMVSDSTAGRIKHWRRHVLMLVFGSVVGAIAFSGGRALSSWTAFGISAGWSLVVWVTQWYGHGFIEEWLSEKAPWQTKPRSRLFLSLLLHILYAIVAIVLVNIMMEWIIAVSRDKPFRLERDGMVDSGIIASAIAIVISVVMTCVGFYHHLRRSLAREAQLEAELATFRYESLRTQLNPHFLFNSLNVLSELVLDDPKQAVQFIRQLSDIYRYILDARERELVPLDEELSFLNTYCDLLKIRFEGALDVHLSIDVLPEDCLVPMALQLLVENAVKHNVVSVREPLQVELLRSEDWLVVRNPLRPLRTPPEKSGRGLDNLKKRFAFFSEQRVVIDDGPDWFEVRLPVLKHTTELIA